MDERQSKRLRVDEAQPDGRSGVTSFLQSWAWKREHRPDRDRFQRPYVHPLRLPDGAEVKLTLEQARFRSGAEGFASTVWDSSIVVAKLLERATAAAVATAAAASAVAAEGATAADASGDGDGAGGGDSTLGGDGAGGAGSAAADCSVLGRGVMDLSAGCGLVAAVAGRLGAARVVATDLPPNLPLLDRNCQRNAGSRAQLEVLPYSWGDDAAPLLRGGPLDLVVACDVMYVEEAVGPLVSSLAALCGGSYDHDGDGDGASSASGDIAGATLSVGPGRGSGDDDGGGDGVGCSFHPTLVLLAHGRNRFAEAAFWRHARAAGFDAERVPDCQLDPG
ncbi:hypothetical protein GPECTOR_7g973 [Gonium pectorale]|uniref:FAM86 N-terminal domain-containing protein n=1 Tax=Gonium pectorale TaxID=33097 RepID=A0A150GUU2_GONPE|nr:hypothetical protein GPECTOR_7g973 [Gonium pectorale]|eukprot:KXZ53523.1 hypothetical protein GPECTOR_7g973 [Gonium pectorale]